MPIPERSILDSLASSAAAALPLNADAVALLQEAGITDLATLAALQVGAGDPSALAYLSDEQRDWLEVRGLIYKGRSGFTHAGILIPTRDPRDHGTVQGFVKVSPGQLKHGFVGPKLGLACRADLDEQGRVVLVDSPVTLLHLQQLGCRHAALVEHPDVVHALYGWFASRRDIVIVSHRQAAGERIRAALGDLGRDARLLVHPSGIQGMSVSSRSILGIAAEPSSRACVASTDITPQLLRDLVEHGRSRVAAGEGAEALRRLEADQPDVVSTYRIGFLSASLGSALGRDGKRALAGMRLGGSVLIPAMDEQCSVVDLYTIRGRAHVRTGLFDQPRGLLAPEVIHASDELIVTDIFRWMARLMREGRRDVLLLRGPLDAQLNAARIASAGVRRVVVRARRDGDVIAAVLHAAGISVQMDRSPVPSPGSPGDDDDEDIDGDPIVVLDDEPTPMPLTFPGVLHEITDQAGTSTSTATIASTAPLAPAIPSQPQPAAHDLLFLEEEADGEAAIFQAGLVRYAVTLSDDGQSRRRVVIRAHGRACTHSLDLASRVQRERTAGSVSRQVGLPPDVIASHLVQLLAGAKAREEMRDHLPTATVEGDDRAAGEAFLAAPDLLDRTTADLSELGWIGEERAKQLLYLASISRLLDEPTWVLHRSGEGAAAWRSVACVAALTPPEHRLVLHRVTEAALMTADSLRHRLLVLDQAETTRPEAALTLRILSERGAVGLVQPRPGSGRELRGPVAVLAAAAGEVDLRCRDCFLPVSADASPAQTALILAEQRRRLGSPGSTAEHDRIVNRHHAAQRLLERLPVRIPFAQRIVFPGSRARHRIEQRWFIGLIAACALLHQRQRERQEGMIVATEEDFDHVRRCTHGLLGCESQGIGAHARSLLAALVEHRLTTFTMADLGALIPDWNRFTHRAAIQDLVAFGHVDSGPRIVGGRGHLRHYRLLATPAVPRGIHLQAVEAVLEADDHRKVAKVAESGDASLSRVAV